MKILCSILGLKDAKKKIRDLIQDLKNSGFYEISGGGKGSHRKFTHKNYAGAVTLSGKISEDAKIYQEKHVEKL